MNQVPHITIKHASIFLAEDAMLLADLVCLFNRRIDAYNKANAEQEQYITADEARKLGAGNAEFRRRLRNLTWSEWYVCNQRFDESTEMWEVQYRAIKPEPVEPHAELKAMYEQQVKDGTLDNFVWEFFYNGLSYTEWRTIIGEKPQFMNNVKYRCTPKPTCQVRNIDTGEIKTMTREAAKLLQGELGDTVEWTNPNNGKTCYLFDAVGIYTYKLKANMVKLNGKLVTREAAIALWESKRDTYSIWYRNNSMAEMWEQDPNHFCWNTQTVNGSEYELRERPRKQISWKDVPVGVAVTCEGLLGAYTFLGANPFNSNYGCVHSQKYGTDNRLLADLELAPADQQPWIAVQDDGNFMLQECFKYHKRYNAADYCELIAFRITGIAKGYELK